MMVPVSALQPGDRFRYSTRIGRPQMYSLVNGDALDQGDWVYVRKYNEDGSLHHRVEMLDPYTRVTKIDG